MKVQGIDRQKVEELFEQAEKELECSRKQMEQVVAAIQQIFEADTEEVLTGLLSATKKAKFVM